MVRISVAVLGTHKPHSGTIAWLPIALTQEIGSVESQGLPSQVQGSETQLGIVPKPVSILGIFYSDTFRPQKD